MKKLLCFAVLLAVLGLTATGGFPKATVEKSNIEVLIDMTEFVPCALGGEGELVDLSGRLHILEHTTTDNNGGVHVVLHYQPKGVKGTGQESGDTYQGTGVTKTSTNVTGAGLPYEFTDVTNFRIIGPGPGNNSLVHVTIHFTINANGETTADVVNAKVECK